jgi:hypothetical protein
LFTVHLTSSGIASLQPKPESLKLEFPDPSLSTRIAAGQIEILRPLILVYRRVLLAASRSC